MSGDIQNDWWNNIPGPIRWLFIGAMLSGVGSGAINFNKDTSDRFKGADFRREIAYRDSRISELERYRFEHTKQAERYVYKIDSMWQLINKTPPNEINGSIRELKTRVRLLEVELAKLEDD